MNPEIQTILDHKIGRIVYYAQSKQHIQVIRVIPGGSQVIEPADRQVLIDFLKSQLSQTTAVTDASTNPHDFMIYIEVPANEDLEPLRALHQKFKKTP